MKVIDIIEGSVVPFQDPKLKKTNKSRKKLAHSILATAEDRFEKIKKLSRDQQIKDRISKIKSV